MKRFHFLPLILCSWALSFAASNTLKTKEITMTDTSMKPPSDEDEHTLLTTEEAATFLRVTRSTLDHYRCVGRGPIYRKHGVRVFYTRASLIRWSQRHASQTCDPEESG